LYPIEFGQIIFKIENLFFGKTMENYPMREIYPLKSSPSGLERMEEETIESQMGKLTEDIQQLQARIVEL